MDKYDCTHDVEEHIDRVRKWMHDFALQITVRSEWHDSSKLREPEKYMFDEFTPKLRELTFGSDEYNQALVDMGEALKHHYVSNRHHPEHWPEGINNMTLVDVIEMVSDWMAAAQAHNKTINLKYLAERFNISDQLLNIIANTLREDDVWRSANGAAIDGEYCPPEMRDRYIDGWERK